MIKLTEQEAMKIVEFRRSKRDKYGWNWYDAIKLAQEIWGKKGFVSPRYRFSSNDPVGPDNYVIPMGDLFEYTVGYERKGRKRLLVTTWNGNSYVEAFKEMYADYNRKNVKDLLKITKLFYEYGLLG
jgi:hypothetical protein